MNQCMSCMRLVIILVEWGVDIIQRMRKMEISGMILMIAQLGKFQKWMRVNGQRICCFIKGKID